LAAGEDGVSEHYAIPYRPAVTMITKKVKFKCKQCHKPGVGAWNARVHPGKCRKLWQAKITKRSQARLAREAAA
jgi:hypothetical protein